MDRRHRIGWIAAVLLTAGAATMWLQPSWLDWQAAAAAGIRVGMLMFVVWLAYPNLQHIPAWMWGGLLTALAIVAWRPRAAVFVIPVLSLVWFLSKGRNRKV